MYVLELFNWYKETKAFKVLKPNSQRAYENGMRVAIEFVKDPVEQIAALEADEIIDELYEYVTPHTAYLTQAVISRAWSVGVRHRLIAHNPFMGMKLAPPAPRKVLWEKEQSQAFVKTANRQGYAGLATLHNLCLIMCQRPGDMIKLRRNNLINGCMKFVQEKTGAEMVIYVPVELQRVLNEVDPSSEFFVLNDETGTPYNTREYNRHATEVKLLCGLPVELQIRDLRRTGLTEAAESGATDSELALLSGHKERNATMLNTYQMKTRTIAMNAMAKRMLTYL